MTEDRPESGLHIDSDWKTEAAREKQRLAEQERTEAPKAPGAGGAPSATMFAELVNALALQAAVALGGFQGPGGERIPPNPAAARHHIELLEVLEQKTRGNLTEEEQRMLGAVLYELRMQYVQSASGPAPKPPSEET